MFTVAVALISLLAGQTTVGRLHGRVFDPSGAVLIGAPVTVVGVTGPTVDTRTDRQGAYAVDRLPPGDYVVMVTANGFADVHQTVTIAADTDQALDITLAIAVQHHEVVVEAASAGGATDPATNATATIIRGTDLDALSDDPNELEAQLHALAGPGTGPNSGQIFIDGFTGGKLPPKSAIQEIRINQNPYSAEFDTFGAGRIEIVTKPGSQTVHGRFLLDGNSSQLNARNPFLTSRPNHHSEFFEGTTSGPLGPAASFVVTGELQDSHEFSAVSAAILDASLNEVPFSQAVANPRSLINVNPRVDLQSARNNTLSIRYRLNDDRELGNGAGQLSLASQVFDLRKTEHDVQASDLQILSATLLNDARFEYRRYDIVQTAQSATPQVTVLGAFTGGGSSLGNSHTIQEHAELHDYVTATHGAHIFRAGGRLRLTSTEDASTQNFNGTFTFESLDAYQTTERGLQFGWTPAQIRSAGGGASQFSIVSGQPAVSDTMIDVGLFAQDDWRLRPNLTLSGGVRVETQNDIAVRADVAPRVSVAWGLGSPKRGNSPQWVLRGGVGVFYDRFVQTLALQAERLDGVRTQQFIVAAPDFFPAVPSPPALANAQIAPTVYRIDDALKTPRTIQAGVSVELQMARSSTLAIGYLSSHGTNQLLSRNVSALADPSSHVSPAYQFESEGTFAQHQLTTNFTLRPRSWLALNGFYVLNSARGNTAGPYSFPSNPLDLSADYGRATFDVRQRFSMFAGIDLPGFRVVPLIVASSSQPFDITVGRDLNGDSIFNDRPAFATDLSRPSVQQTPYGAFDTVPIRGQMIIPRNFAMGPSQISVNLRVMKPFVVRDHDTIRLDVVVSNLFNHVNVTPPVGNLSSALFGRSTGLANTLSPSANRQVHVQLQFLF